MIAERGRKRSSEFYSVYSVFRLFGAGIDFSMVCVVRMHSRGRIWSLFSIAYQIPKLEVAGSTPVSRSIESIDERFCALLLAALVH